MPTSRALLKRLDAEAARLRADADQLAWAHRTVEGGIAMARADAVEQLKATLLEHDEAMQARANEIDHWRGRAGWGRRIEWTPL